MAADSKTRHPRARVVGKQSYGRERRRERERERGRKKRGRGEEAAK
jgi:hypothetical protein